MEAQYKDLQCLKPQSQQHQNHTIRIRISGDVPNNLHFHHVLSASQPLRDSKCNPCTDGETEA